LGIRVFRSIKLAADANSAVLSVKIAFANSDEVQSAELLDLIAVQRQLSQSYEIKTANMAPHAQSAISMLHLQDNAAATPRQHWKNNSYQKIKSS